MKTAILISAAAAALVSGAAAQAQPQNRPWRPLDPGRPDWSPRTADTGTAHRLEMDRLRAVSDRNAEAARVEADRTRATLQGLRVQPTPPVASPNLATGSVPAPDRPSSPPRQGDAGQIDAWLDRRPGPENR